MRLSDFYPNGKPARVSTLTSGSGTFTPLVTPAWVRVTLVGGGAGGKGGSNGTASTAYGGGAGQTIVAWQRLTSSAGYSVAASAPGGAAGGSNGTEGGVTTFGTLTAHGGKSTTSVGGGYDTAAGVILDSGFGGMAGGAGGFVVGTKASGRGPGAPMTSTTAADYVGGGASGSTAGSYLGGSGGGSSMYGQGGAGGNANSSGTGAVGGAGSGYGAGGGGGGHGSSAGGAGGAGSGGLLIIEEWAE